MKYVNNFLSLNMDLVNTFVQMSRYLKRIAPIVIILFRTSSVFTDHTATPIQLRGITLCNPTGTSTVNGNKNYVTSSFHGLWPGFRPAIANNSPHAWGSWQFVAGNNMGFLGLVSKEDDLDVANCFYIPE